MNDNLVDRIQKSADFKFKQFQAKLIPNVPTEKIIGVKTPYIKSLAKEYFSTETYKDFINDLPHRYFEENSLHSFMISLEKDFDVCVGLVDGFLPYIDNWATCDCLSPKCFALNKIKLLPYLYKWLKSGKEYTVRFAVKMFMTHFLDNDFKEDYLDLVVSVKSEKYYVKMMIAWYIATALVKQYDYAVCVLGEKRLDAWTHDKSIQKAIESYRLSDEQKAYLKTLKINKRR